MRLPVQASSTMSSASSKRARFSSMSRPEPAYSCLRSPEPTPRLSPPAGGIAALLWRVCPADPARVDAELVGGHGLLEQLGVELARGPAEFLRVVVDDG